MLLIENLVCIMRVQQVVCFTGAIELDYSFGFKLEPVSRKRTLALHPPKPINQQDRI